MYSLRKIQTSKLIVEKIVEKIVENVETNILPTPTDQDKLVLAHDIKMKSLYGSFNTLSDLIEKEKDNTKKESLTKQRTSLNEHYTELKTDIDNLKSKYVIYGFYDFNGNTHTTILSTYAVNQFVYYKSDLILLYQEQSLMLYKYHQHAYNL